MGVKRDENGRRSVEMQVELEGTPEQVWRAVATGPGNACWFVPTEIEEREGGRIVFHLDETMTSKGTVTAWEPPSRFAYVEADWMPGAPPVATEVTIEARPGGTCLMRMSHSLSASVDDWDGFLESFESGWPQFFRVLEIYVSRFAGTACAPVRVSGEGSGTHSEAWARMTAALGLEGAAAGERRRSPDGDAPVLAGVVDRVGSSDMGHDLTMRLEEPAAGVAVLNAYTWEGRVSTSVTLYLYGDGAADAAARAEPAWRAWMNRHFPKAASASPAAEA